MSTMPLRTRLRPILAWNRPLVLMTGAMAVATIVCVIGLVVDDRLLIGEPIWLKPFKFAVSIGLYSFAWAWMISLLPRRSRPVSGAAAIITTVLGLEYAILITQVIRGKRSHFNVSTPFDQVLFITMGVSIAVLWVATFVMSVFVVRNRFGSRSQTFAVRVGAALSLVGMGLGGLMLAPTAAQRASMRDGTFQGFVGAHSVGVADGGPGMPITHWSTTGGDLRVPHFVGMHALQLFPLLAAGLAALAPRVPVLRDDRVRARLILTAGGGYAGLTALVTWQALRGQPLIHPDGLTLGALAALLAGLVVAVVVALRPAGRPIERELASA